VGEVISEQNGAERDGQELFATCPEGGPPGGGIKSVIREEKRREEKRRRGAVGRAWRPCRAHLSLEREKIERRRCAVKSLKV
jgi:hypothetical protein